MKHDMLTEQQQADVRAKFLTWLREDAQGVTCTVDFRNGGFMVKGRKTMLRNNQLERVVDVMKEYGFADNVEVSGFLCRYSPEDARRGYPDTFRFFPKDSGVQAPDFL